MINLKLNFVLLKLVFLKT